MLSSKRVLILPPCSILTFIPQVLDKIDEEMGEKNDNEGFDSTDKNPSVTGPGLACKGDENRAPVSAVPLALVTSQNARSSSQSSKASHSQGMLGPAGNTLTRDEMMLLRLTNYVQRLSRAAAAMVETEGIEDERKAIRFMAALADPDDAANTTSHPGNHHHHSSGHSRSSSNSNSNNNNNGTTDWNDELNDTTMCEDVYNSQLNESDDRGPGVDGGEGEGEDDEGLMVFAEGFEEEEEDEEDELGDRGMTIVSHTKIVQLPVASSAISGMAGAGAVPGPLANDSTNGGCGSNSMRVPIWLPDEAVLDMWKEKTVMHQEATATLVQSHLKGYVASSQAYSVNSHPLHAHPTYPTATGATLPIPSVPPYTNNRTDLLRAAPYPGSAPSSGPSSGPNTDSGSGPGPSRGSRHVTMSIDTTTAPYQHQSQQHHQPKNHHQQQHQHQHHPSQYHQNRPPPLTLEGTGVGGNDGSEDTVPEMRHKVPRILSPNKPLGQGGASPSFIAAAVPVSKSYPPVGIAEIVTGISTGTGVVAGATAAGGTMRVSTSASEMSISTVHASTTASTSSSSNDGVDDADDMALLALMDSIEQCPRPPLHTNLPPPMTTIARHRENGGAVGTDSRSGSGGVGVSIYPPPSAKGMGGKHSLGSESSSLPLHGLGVATSGYLGPSPGPGAGTSPNAGVRHDTGPGTGAGGGGSASAYNGGSAEILSLPPQHQHHHHHSRSHRNDSKAVPSTAVYGQAPYNGSRAPYPPSATPYPVPASTNSYPGPSQMNTYPGAMHPPHLVASTNNTYSAYANTHAAAASNTHSVPNNPSSMPTHMNVYSAVAAAAATGASISPPVPYKGCSMTVDDADDDALLALWDKLDEQKCNGQVPGREQGLGQGSGPGRGPHSAAIYGQGDVVNPINSSAIATPKRPYFDQQGQGQDRGQGHGQGQEQGGQGRGSSTHHNRSSNPPQMPPSPFTPLLQALRLSSPSTTFSLKLLPATTTRINTDAVILDPAGNDPIAAEQEGMAASFVGDGRDQMGVENDEVGVENDEVGVENDEVGVDPVADLRFPLHDDDQVLYSSSDDDPDDDNDEEANEGMGEDGGNDDDGNEGQGADGRDQGEEYPFGRKGRGKRRGRRRDKKNDPLFDCEQSENGEEGEEEGGDGVCRMDVVDSRNRRDSARLTRSRGTAKSPYLQAFSPSQVRPLM